MLIESNVLSMKGLLTLVLLILVFIFDLLAPLGIAAGTPYGIVVLSTLWVKKNSITYATATLCILLTIAGFFLSSDIANSIDTVLINRLLAIIIIISSSFLVIERKNAEEKIKTLYILSSTDHLTQVKNKLSFSRNLRKEIIRSKRYKRNLFLAIIDIDNFKNINDSYGHTQGDATIKKISNEIIASIRESDTLYRIGGDEFAIIFVETNTNDATIIGNKICNRVANTISIERINVTLSIGISSFDFNKSESNEESLFKRADKALYLSKNKGRNNVSIVK